MCFFQPVEYSNPNIQKLDIEFAHISDRTCLCPWGKLWRSWEQILMQGFNHPFLEISPIWRNDKNVGDPKRKTNWTVADLSPVCTWQSPSFTLLLVLYYSFLKSRIAAALVESDATEEQKEEATARYFLWPICSCNVNSILLERCKWFLATPAAGCHILMQGTSKHCEMDWDRGSWLCLGARAKKQVVIFVRLWISEQGRFSV